MTQPLIRKQEYRFNTSIGSIVIHISWSGKDFPCPKPGFNFFTYRIASHHFLRKGLYCTGSLGGVMWPFSSVGVIQLSTKYSVKIVFLNSFCTFVFGFMFHKCIALCCYCQEGSTIQDFHILDVVQKVQFRLEVTVCKICVQVNTTKTWDLHLTVVFCWEYFVFSAIFWFGLIFKGFLLCLQMQIQ